MIKVGIVGGTGYTGVELLRLLAQHAKVEIAAAKEFDVVIVNDNAERAADELWNVIASEYDL